MRHLELIEFKHIGRGDSDLVGSKGANLGELVQAGLPVPPGFAVSGHAFKRFMAANKLEPKIRAILTQCDIEKTRDLERAAKEIQQLILLAKMPKDLEKNITELYRKLFRYDSKPVAVAVRSSLAVSDSNDAFLGQQPTFLNILGESGVVRSIHHIWASVFDPRAIYYRQVKGFNYSALTVAVVVQGMVQAGRAGVMFTTNSLTGNPEELVIEAAYGLGEVVVLGAVTPDRYVVEKSTKRIVDTMIHQQTWKLVRTAAHRAGGTRHQSVPRLEQRRQKLTSDEILTLANLGLTVEQHYHYPQNIEWAIDEKDRLWLVETEALAEAQPDPAPAAVAATTHAEVLVRGLAASLGLATGPVRVIHKPSQIDQVETGDVLVIETTAPGYLPAMRRAKAIVTDTGGSTSHAVVMARELGIPCVAGTGTGTSHLKSGLVVTVDGHTGVVYKGKVTAPAAKDQRAFITNGPVITATKIMINLADPTKAEEYAKLPVDGVGLLRAEFMIAGMGVHPRYLLKEKKEHLFIRKLTDGIRTIGQAFNPRPVIYRASDYKTNEYRSLTGGDKVEPKEENPMLGYRGALRYLREPDLFQMELQALKTVRESYGLRHVSLMIPFVRTVEELVQVRQLIEPTGMLKDPDFKLWMMAEIPSNVLMLEDFIAAGIDGVSIGSNDLTQLILGVDRDNARLAGAFDERHPAVMGAMRHIVELARKHHISVSICGQAASTYPEVSQELIQAGITSLSVTPDSAVATRRLVASIERRLLLDNLTHRIHAEAHPLW